MLRPLKKIGIPLDKEFSVNLVVWRTFDDLYKANKEHGKKDYDALFVEHPNHPCIGTIHVEKSVTQHIIIHELKHALDYYIYQVMTEKTATMLEECTKTIEAVLESLNV